MTKEIASNFISLLKIYFSDDSLQKMKISGQQLSENECKEVSIRTVILKAGKRLQFVYRYPTKDITKNFTLDEALTIMERSLLIEYRNISLISNDKIHQYNPQKNKINTTSNKSKIETNQDNDRQRNRIISTDKLFLRELGITSSNSKVFASKQSKYKQLNKYLEIIEPLLQKANLSDSYSLTDMGSGKGYLTFALYDYLKQTKKKNIQIVGVEMRSDLVEKCNALSMKLGYDGLTFKEGVISEHVDKTDVLIALHACDTATDDAIIAGINADAKLIICSPCCHKQVRLAMTSTENNSSIIQHGIMKERLAEMLTDTIRGLVLEMHGYKTQIMEFISTSHTPKNLLITAIKRDGDIEQQKYINEINYLKKQYGIKSHYLEKIITT